MRIVGIDPGSERTGYGCVETDGRRHRLVTCGAISAVAGDSFPTRLARIHRELATLFAKMRPDCVAVESVFHAVNARSALKLGHARGVALLAAVEAGCTIVEYTPAEVKRAVVGYGRAEKRQVQHMIKLLLGLAQPPTPYDAADALAIAICHLHSAFLSGNRDQGSKAGIGDRGSGINGTGPVPDPGSLIPGRGPGKRQLKSWRQYRPPAHG